MAGIARVPVRGQEIRLPLYEVYITQSVGDLSWGFW